MNIEIEEVREVVGRGTIFLVDLQKCGYTDLSYIEKIPINIGETIQFRGDTYIITGIEAWKVSDVHYKSKIGLRVTKINYVEENIRKSITPSR